MWRQIETRQRFGQEAERARELRPTYVLVVNTTYKVSYSRRT
jgi:hypothetical protein